MNRSALAVGMLTVGIVGLGLVACSPLSPREDPTRFYVLTGVGASESDDAAKLDITIGVGPVRLSPYLERTPLPTRVGDNEVEYSEIDRWAEPLADVFPFVQAQNLEYFLDPNDVEIYPWQRSIRVDYTIEIDVIAFERNTDGDAELQAAWDIEDGSGHEVYSHFSDITQPATTNTTQASVAALSAAAADLSRVIATAIRELEAQK